MVKLHKRPFKKGYLYGHWCPGCDSPHEFPVGASTDNGASWRFDNDMEKPSFTPSVHFGPGTSQCCHYFIVKGTIRYLPDCHHELKGTTIPLPEIPPMELEYLKSLKRE